MMIMVLIRLHSILGKSNLRPAGVMVVLVKLTEDPLSGMASTVQT